MSLNKLARLVHQHVEGRFWFIISNSRMVIAISSYHRYEKLVYNLLVGLCWAPTLAEQSYLTCAWTVHYTAQKFNAARKLLACYFLSHTDPSCCIALWGTFVRNSYHFLTLDGMQRWISKEVEEIQVRGYHLWEGRSGSSVLVLFVGRICLIITEARRTKNDRRL